MSRMGSDAPVVGNVTTKKAKTFVSYSKEKP